MKKTNIKDISEIKYPMLTFDAILNFIYETGVKN
jgi:hypothetical protein